MVRSKVNLRPCFAPSEQGVVPVLDVVAGDVALHLLHLALVRQHDHHGGVALVRQHDDGRVVVLVLVELEAAGPLHHVHLHLGVLVHLEVLLGRLLGVERFLPRSCARRRGKENIEGPLFYHPV